MLKQDIWEKKKYLLINDTEVSQTHKKTKQNKKPFQLLRLDRNFNSFSFLQISTDHTSIFINKQKFFWNDILQEKNYILQEKKNIYKHLKNNRYFTKQLRYIYCSIKCKIINFFAVTLLLLLQCKNRDTLFIFLLNNGSCS